jgi:hypothetical protein
MIHMAQSRTIGRKISWLTVGLTICGCSAAGSRTQLFEVADDTTPAVPGAGQMNATPPANSPPPGIGSPASPGTNGEAGSCVTTRALVEPLRQPVDIIVALDNSASMDDEARAVEDNLNTNFAATLNQNAVDYRLILVSEHRERDAQDTAVCIVGPLSTLATCPSEQPGPSERFFQYSTEVGSSNSFEVLLETFTGERTDDFDLAPSGWSEWLRPEASKVFLEITDDDENSPAVEFVSSLTALAPEHFGLDPSQIRFVWHSIVGLAERPVASDPHVPTDPIEEEECEGDVFNAGTTYQELSRLTGGLRFPICELDGYGAVFERVAGDVVTSSRGACDFAIPEPPLERSLELDQIALSYTPSTAGEARLLGQVRSPHDCGPDAFVIDGTGLHLCPDVCDVVRADERATVEVLFTCESTLLL